jgi:MFS transporter, DHA3 family, macrolide efflux protein
MQMKPTLWKKDFTIITLGTVVSAIGGTAMSFALSLVVFDNTDSTWLSGLFAAVMMVPATVLPLFTAPLVDTRCRRNIIAGLDFFTGFLYLAFSVYLYFHSFSYILYMLFGLIINCIGCVYSQAYDSLYPELIPEGFAQKGYSVSSLIYPTAATVITPLAAIIYEKQGITLVFIIEGVLLLVAAVFECFITKDRGRREKVPFSMKEYFHDMLGGIRYLKLEKGVRGIYSYMAVANAVSGGNDLMSMAFFQSTFGMGTTMYSLLISSETLGRMLGGFLHYFIKIPPAWRYRITEKVYLIYETLDGVMLLLYYPIMVVIRFILGFLGVNTATLRSAAVQKYLPSEVRARVEAVFSVMIALGTMLIRLIAGALGEVLPYPVITILLSLLALFCVYAFVIRNKQEISAIYERNE